MVDDPVAFTAILNGHYNPSEGEKVPYSSIITNVGGGYITQRNEFVCLHTGLYIFYVAAYAGNTANCRLAIMKNDVEVIRLYTVNTYGTTGTNMLVLELVEVDTVSVTSAQSGCQLWGTESFNTFSGFRIN